MKLLSKLFGIRNSGDVLSHGIQAFDWTLHNNSSVMCLCLCHWMPFLCWVLCGVTVHCYRFVVYVVYSWKCVANRVNLTRHSISPGKYCMLSSQQICTKLIVLTYESLFLLQIIHWNKKAPRENIICMFLDRSFFSWS